MYLSATAPQDCARCGQRHSGPRATHAMCEPNGASFRLAAIQVRRCSAALDAHHHRRAPAPVLAEKYRRCDFVAASNA